MSLMRVNPVSGPTWAGLALVLAAAVAGGCGGPEGGMGELTAQDVIRMPTEPNVVSIMALYSPFSPWIWNEDRSKVRGIYISGLYLLGPKGKGVFGDGTIRPRLYVAERGPDGKKHPRQVKEWSFTVEEALPFRGKQKRTLGWGYGLPLDFGDLDLSGREIQILVAFKRSDGRMATSSKQTFIVPGAAD